MTEFGLYLRIAKKWWWLVLASTLLAAAGGWGYARTIPPLYQTSASLLVSAGNSAGDYSTVMASEKMAETYKELLTKRPVIEQAARALELDPDQVASKVEARLIARTLIIELVVVDRNPRIAAAIANSMVMAFMDTLRDAVNARPRDIAVVELAMPPAAPVSPHVARIVVVAGLAGFVLAAGAASGIELARDPLESVQDVHRSLALPMLAAIPRYGLTRPGLRKAALCRQTRMPVSLSAPDASATEAYRTLRTWFQIAYRGARLPTLLVTGPQSGRETVHVVANLGVVLAQAGLKTVLLDADLRRADARRPALPYMGLYQDRDLSAEPGLSALLAGAGDWRPYVVDTVIPGLHLIPSGVSPSDPLGLLSSPRMASLIRELEGHFEVVLIHGPSILAAPDALVLATQVAGTLLVIESGATSRRSATRALTLLQHAETRVLGTVLTRVRARSPESGSYSDLSVADRRSHTQIEAEPSLAWLESDEMVGASRL